MSDKLRVLMFTRSVTNVRLLMFGTSVLLPRIAFRLVRVWLDNGQLCFFAKVRVTSYPQCARKNYENMKTCSSEANKSSSQRAKSQ